MIEIPIEGGSGKMKSSALKFKNDWPGLFLRGDDAMFLAVEIEEILEILKDKQIETSTFKLEKTLKIIQNEVLTD